MRLVAWNCCERFDRNYHHLLGLDFDVAVVTECGPFEPGLSNRTVTSVMRLGVDQPGHTKHLGVVARDPWRVEGLPGRVDQPWLLRAKVSGPLEFTVLAVWTLGPEWVTGRLSYAAQTARVVEEVLPSLAGPVVLAGDLNAPIRSSSASTRLHAANVDRLSEQGLVSAFNAARGEAADPLAEPTFFHRWNAAHPFHIDHVFVPTQWTDDIRVAVGRFDEWVGAKRSDHVPVVVDLELPG